MKRLFQFSANTFQSLPQRSQHKKCAELLKEIHCCKEKALLQAEYQKLCSWMGIEAISWNEEAIERRFHEHLRLSGRSIAEHDFLSNLIVGDSKEGAPWLFIHTYLDGLRSCHNVGSIVRTTESFRLGPIHLSCDMMACDHPQIKKTSMGAFDHVTISHGTDLRTLPKPWIAIETVRGAPAYNEMLYPESCTLVLGNEERGIQASLLKECDFVVTIPLAGRKNSLNVANAFAIVASEVALQRRQ